jgi:hypothetical protein
MNRNIFVAAILSIAAAGAFAQTSTDASVQRDAKQQQRIEQGLQNGSITTREAGLLERDESKVDHLQAKALKDGKLNAHERAQLKAAQDKASRDISTATHNGVNGNPLSASSQRMQADVQRDLNQEKRIDQGVKNGSLTNHEVARLERGQAKADHKEYVAARDGHVGKKEQRSVQHTEDRDSKAIHHQKHDDQNRKS